MTSEQRERVIKKLSFRVADERSEGGVSEKSAHYKGECPNFYNLIQKIGPSVSLSGGCLVALFAVAKSFST